MYNLKIDIKTFSSTIIHKKIIQSLQILSVMKFQFTLLRSYILPLAENNFVNTS